MFPNLWNAIQIQLKKTTSAKILKQTEINIHLENYERFKCKTVVVYHVSRFYIKIKTKKLWYILYWAVCNFSF